MGKRTAGSFGPLGQHLKSALKAITGTITQAAFYAKRPKPRSFHERH